MSGTSIILPVSSHTIEQDGISLKSNSTGKPGFSKTAIPHYLRASTGSCHDFCKYGRREAYEEKPWCPMRRRSAGNLPDIDRQISAEIEVILSCKKKPGVKLKPSSQTSSNVCDSCEIIKYGVSTKSHGTRRNSLGTEVGNDRICRDSETMYDRKKALIVSIKRPPDPEHRISDSVGVIKQDMSPKAPSRSQKPLQDEVPDSVLAGKNISETYNKPSSDSEVHVSASSNIVKHIDTKNSRPSHKMEPKFPSKGKKSALRLKSGDSNSKLKNASENDKHGLPSSGKLKIWTQVAPQKVSARSASSKIKPLADRPSSSNGKSAKGSKMANKAGTSNAASSKVAVWKAVAPPRPSSSKVSAKKVKPSPTSLVDPRPVPSRVSSSNLRKKQNQNVGSTLRNRKNRSSEPNQPDVDQVPEKTLYAVEVATEKRCIQTENNGGHDEPHPCPSSTPIPQSSTTQEGIDDCITDKHEVLDKESENASTYDAADSEGKDVESMELNFQRVKVTDVHSDSNSPRMLRIRQGRNVGEMQNVKMNSERRSSKQRNEVQCFKSSPQADSEKVVLRRQDMEKKDAQGLLNNLIEETASKLVETRKSKVKALVGAFESVISTKKPNI